MITDSLNNVLTQGLIVIGSIATTYLTVKYKNNIIGKNKVALPKDRFDTIYEGYEKLITQQQKDIERKTLVINNLENIVNQLRNDLDKTTVLLEKAQVEVRESRESNKEMARQLAVLKKDHLNV